MPSKKCTIQYRYTKTSDLPRGFNLKNSIVQCLRATHGEHVVGHNARARIIDLDQDQSFVILNKITDAEGWDRTVFTGQLIHLQEGADVAAVLQSLEEDAEEFLLEQVNLGEEARVLKGSMYFAAVDNHIGLIEGQQVKGRTLERYLTSLFQRHAIIDAGAAVRLNSSFIAGDGKQLSEASEISVSAEPNRGPTAEAAEAAAREIAAEAARIQRDGATVFDVLKLLGWGTEAIEKLRGEIPDDGWIEGLFKVLIKRKGRKKTISRATIDEALRNIDPEDLGLSGDGSERGGIVKLSTKRSVQLIGALQDPEDAVVQIVNALRDWARSGKIDCDFEGST